MEISIFTVKGLTTFFLGDPTTVDGTLKLLGLGTVVSRVKAFSGCQLARADDDMHEIVFCIFVLPLLWTLKSLFHGLCTFTFFNSSKSLFKFKSSLSEISMRGASRSPENRGVVNGDTSLADCSYQS